MAAAAAGVRAGWEAPCAAGAGAPAGRAEVALPRRYRAEQVAAATRPPLALPRRRVPAEPPPRSGGEAQDG